MDKPYVLLDCDGVLLDWELGLKRWLEHAHPHLSQPTYYDENSFELSLRYNISPAEGNQMVWDFHNHMEFTKLEPLAGSQQAIADLNQTHALVVITACGQDPTIARYRRENLKNCFGDVFEEIICVNHSIDKAFWLNQYPPSYWVEDHQKNANMGVEFAHKSFLISAPYNKNKVVKKEVIVVSSLLEASQIILARSHSMCPLEAHSC
jgi:uncharacterized HAD superfamily protein